MKIYFHILILTTTLMSCSEYKKITCRRYNYDSHNDVKAQLMIPRGFKRIKNIYDHSIEHHFIYPDSSIIFISNNKFVASRINSSNRVEKGIDPIYRRHINDTVRMEGENNGHFWKEILFDMIAVGM